MKPHPFIVILIAVFSGHALGDSIPTEAKTLLEQRQKAIEKIDEKMTQELEKIKVDYTKRGNLEAAVAVAELIKKFPTSTGPVLDGSWKRDVDGGIFTFDGRGGGFFKGKGNKEPFIIFYDPKKGEFILLNEIWWCAISNGANDKTMNGYSRGNSKWVLTKID